MTTAELLAADGSLTELGRAALAAAAGQADPQSLAAATSLRRDFPAELAVAALSQEYLRRRARTKFGAAASTMFFTPAGLEQATRPVVSRWRAQQMISQEVCDVVDLGCGVGADSMAFRDTGLSVAAVERDEATATVARANLGAGVNVTVGDAEQLPLADQQFAFCDPARRDGSGRVWNVADFSPGWDFVTGLLRRPAGAWIKLGPALPHRLIPDGVDATWISVSGDVVEAALTSNDAAAAKEVGAPRLRAVLLQGTLDPTSDPHTPVRYASIDGTAERATVGEIGSWLHEPDGAVIRAGAVATLAGRHAAVGVADQIAYLSSDAPMRGPFATDFEVRDVLPWKEKTLRQWVREHQIGSLEIKKRGIDIDPAALRRRLKPKGPNAATLVLTPTPLGAKVVVVRRDVNARAS